MRARRPALRAGQVGVWVWWVCCVEEGTRPPRFAGVAPPSSGKEVLRGAGGILTIGPVLGAMGKRGLRRRRARVSCVSL